MGFLASCTGIKLRAGTAGGGETSIFVRGNVGIRQSNDFKTKRIAGDNFFIVPIKKMERELRLTCLIDSFTTINTLAGILVTPQKWTFTIDDHAAAALRVDGTNSIVGYLKSMDYKLDGLEYDVELTWVIGK